MQNKPQRSAVSVTEFRSNIKKFTQDSTNELFLTNKGDVVGVFVGIDAWRANQEMLALLNNPQALMYSLVMHRRFQETGEPVGISLEDFDLKLKQGNADASTV